MGKLTKEQREEVKQVIINVMETLSEMESVQETISENAGCSYQSISSEVEEMFGEARDVLEKQWNV